MHGGGGGGCTSAVDKKWYMAGALVLNFYMVQRELRVGVFAMTIYAV